VSSSSTAFSSATSARTSSCSGVSTAIAMSAMRDEDLAHRRHVLQAVEAFVDLVEADAAAHHAVDRQLALLVERDEARDVADRHAASHVRALDGLFLADQAALLEGEIGAERRQAR